MKKIYILVICLLLLACTEDASVSVEPVEITNANLEVEETNNEVVTNTEEDTQSSYENKTVSANTDSNEAATTPTYFNRFEVVVRVDKLNVRAEPNIDAKKLSVVTLDEQYLVYKKHVDEVTGEYWYYIKLEDKTMGWIAGWFATMADKSYVTLYSDMNLESDRMAFVDKNAITSRKFRGIYSGKYAIEWYETEFLGQVLYCDLYTEKVETVTWPIYYKTDYSTEEFVFSEDNPGYVHFGYREVSIETSEGLIYINTEHRTVYREDKSLGETSFELNDIYRYRDFHTLPDGYLFLNDYRSEYWLRSYDDYNLNCYEIVGKRLKEKKVFQLKFTEDTHYIHAYDSPYKIFDNDVSKYEYTGYVDEKDLLGYRRYYDGYSSFDVMVANIDDKEMFASYNAYNLDEETTVILPSGDIFVMSTSSRMMESPLYKKGYINYKIGSQYYTKNYLSDFEMPYRSIYYFNNNQHMLIQSESNVYIYNIGTSTPQLLFETTESEYISEILECDDLIIIQCSRHTYPIILKRNGDDYEVVFNENNVSPVFEKMDLNSKVVGVDSLKDINEKEAILQVLSDKMIVWNRRYDGYVLNKIYNREFFNEGFAYSYLSNEFDQVINSKGEKISGDLTSLYIIPTNVIDSPYIIVKSSDGYYSIHLEALDMKFLGTDVKHVKNTDFIIAYSENGIGSAVDLYRVGLTLDHLDQYASNLIGGELSSGPNNMSISYSDYEGLQSVYEFKQKKVVFEVKNDALNPNGDNDSTVDVYTSANYKSDVTRTLSSDELINPIRMDRFQLMNDEIILWYEIKVDNKPYYIHKKLNEMKFVEYDHEMLELMLEDDSIIGYSTGGECAYYLVLDNLGDKGYLSIYHSWEGTYGTFVNMKTGKMIRGLPYEFEMSPNEKYFVSFDFDYDDGCTYIELFNIKDNDIDNVITFDIGYERIQSAKWISNEEVVLETYSDKKHDKRQIRLLKVENTWQLRD